MTIFEAIGFAYVTLCTLLATAAAVGLALRGAKTIYRDSELGAKYRESFNRMFQEGVER